MGMVIVGLITSASILMLGSAFYRLVAVDDIIGFSLCLISSASFGGLSAYDICAEIKSALEEKNTEQPEQ